MNRMPSRSRLGLLLWGCVLVLAPACGSKGGSTPPVAPVITVQPMDLTVVQGQTASFHVAASGTEPLAVQWSRNGVPLPEGRSFTWTTGPTVLGDSGSTFTATVSNGAGGVTSRAAFLVVQAQAPSGLVYATNPLVCVRGQALAPDIPAVAGGAPTAWSVAPALPAGLRMDGTTGVLSGTPQALSPAASYEVTAANAGGSARALLSIAVVDVPPIPSYGSPSCTFTRGVALDVLRPVNSGGAADAWSIVPALPAGLSFSAFDGSLGGTPTALADPASYAVTARNSGGEGSVRILLSVVPGLAPAIVVQPADQTVGLGGAATFSVTATGTAPLAYQWRRGAVPLAGATGSSFTTAPATALDQGAAYSVIVNNGVGPAVTSREAILTVLGPAPSITAQPLPQALVAGQAGSFQVTASGDGPLSYQWFRNGLPVPGATGRVWTFTAASADDGALVKVVATTSLGGVASSEAVALTVLPAATAAPTFVLQTHPDDGMTPLYALMDGAQKSIELVMYQFTGDTTALSALTRAAARGVKVRVILDGISQKSTNTAAYNTLTAAGIRVHWSSPAYAYTHQKTLVIDHARAAILTHNLARSYYATGRDFGVVVDDPADIAAILTTFEADFLDAPITPPLGTDLVWSPTNARSAITDVIAKAAYSLRVEQLEMNDTLLVNAMVAALQRGVSVLIVNENQNNSYTANLTILRTAGAQIRTYSASTGYFIHAKVILADHGQTSARMFVGSENFSNNSLSNNRELGVVFSDPACLNSFLASFTSDFNGGAAF